MALQLKLGERVKKPERQRPARLNNERPAANQASVQHILGRLTFSLWVIARIPVASMSPLQPGLQPLQSAPRAATDPNNSVKYNLVWLGARNQATPLSTPINQSTNVVSPLNSTVTLLGEVCIPRIFHDHKSNSCGSPKISSYRVTSTSTTLMSRC
jgi:hypothetical protein